MNNLSIAQLELTFNQGDGPQWCPEAGEYARQLPDGCFCWGETPAACNRVYFEALRVMADHRRRCPDDIPFDGRPVAGPELTPADRYGLEARQ